MTYPFMIGGTTLNFWTLFGIAVGLSMDAFAVSICKGLAVQKMNWKYGVIAGLYFGGFQALMPTIGYLLGVQFQSLITSIDHWIAFFLLAVIGGNMIRESRQEAEALDDSYDVKTMLLLAIATSIDALAVGVTFAFLEVRILPAATFIGLTTFLFGLAGIYIGHFFGARFKNKAEFIGGLILIVIGCKILLEHLGIF